MTKVNIINKAIEEADLIFLDGGLIKPYVIDDNELFYLDMVMYENKFVKLCELGEVKAYEQ